MRRSSRSRRKPQRYRASGRHDVSPAAWKVATAGPCHRASAPGLSMGASGSCTWMRSKFSFASVRRSRGSAGGLITRFESAPLPGTITDRPSGITLGGGSPCRPVRGWRMRLNEPGGSFPIRRRVSIPSASRERACASAWSTTPPPNDHEYGTTIPTFTGPRLPPPAEQHADDRSCEQELRLGGDAGSVPANAAVEELLSAQPEPGDDVLEVGHGSRRSSQHSGVEETSPGGQQTERDEPAADLEASVGNVLVRHPVAGEVQRWTERESKRPRAKQRAGRASGGHMQRHDHRANDRVCSAPWVCATGGARWQGRLTSGEVMETIPEKSTRPCARTTPRPTRPSPSTKRTSSRKTWPPPRSPRPRSAAPARPTRRRSRSGSRRTSSRKRTKARSARKTRSASVPPGVPGRLVGVHP